MQVEININDLKQAFKKVVAIGVPSKTPGILHYALLETNGNKSAMLKATNLKQFIHISLPIDTIEAGAVLLPIKPFKKLISKVSTSSITIKSGDDDTQISIFIDGVSIVLQSADVMEFPTSSLFGHEEVVSMCPDILHDCLNRLRPTLGKENDGGWDIACMRLRVSSGSLQFTTTDGHGLTQMNYKGALREVEKDYLIPYAAIKLLEKLLPKSGKNISIKLSEKYISFIFENIIFQSKLLPGPYPQVERVLPEPILENECFIPRKKLMQALEVLGITANDYDHVDVQMGNGTMLFKTFSPLLGESRRSFAIASPQSLSKPYNLKYLLSSLKVCSAEHINMTIFDTGILTIKDGNFSRYNYLLMCCVIPEEEKNE